MLVLVLVFAAFYFVAPKPAVAAEQSSRPTEFNRDIRSILAENCFACHGPDEKQRQEALRLDTKDGIFEDRGDYRIVVPRDPASSRLFQRISAAHEGQRMPPVKSGKKLTDQQIERIRTWIEQGARWEEHWAFVPPQRPALPAVKNSSWPRNPLDHFVLARLEAAGLKPSPEADKVTLIRRVTFDLTGLPPTPAEVDAFLADTSPDAYEKLVDRLLGSPRYGERMAMKWLDFARYADTHGYHVDSHRDMWIWRDWVIDAFNRNLSFDQFTIEQLAGDLLPSATLQQKIATGFSRNHMINFEGGAIAEEYQNEYVVDRVNTAGTVWMGLTIGCARCHDHKFDPITQRDFYRLYAFFNDIPEKGLDGHYGNAEPYAQVPSPSEKAELEKLTAQISEVEKAMPADSEIEPLQAAWEKTALQAMPPLPQKGIAAIYEFDNHLADTSGYYQHGDATKGDVVYEEGRIRKSAEFDSVTEVSFGSAGDSERNAPFSIAAWMHPMSPKASDRMVVFSKLDPSQTLRGYGLSFTKAERLPYTKLASRIIFYMIHKWPDSAIELMSRKSFLLRAWHHVAVLYDGSSRAAGVQLYVDGEVQEFETLKDNLNGSIRNTQPLYIGKKPGERPYEGRIDELRFYNRLLEKDEIDQLAIHHPIRALLAQSGKRTDEQKREIRQYYLSRHAPLRFRDLNAQLTQLKKEKENLDRSVPNTMVMQHMEKLRDTFILARGDYRNHGDKVTPGVPSCLPPLPADANPDRLALARWLVNPSHPLTARVAVNRFWEMYFGAGLVSTMENFGVQGEAPSHPELLDWLATEFVRTAWNTRAMQKLFVTSATYRQSSRMTPELREKDPQNRLLARAPRLRLPAEMIRDTALAVSGLLNGTIGGPSVFPYQPPGLWELISYGERFTAQSYTQSHGKDLYRRSMYTFWKRTSPPPSMGTFDAPDRETCTVKRARTNTPLQALVLMNDPTYVEAARALAERAMLEGGQKPDQRITYAFRLASARKPEPSEVQILRETFKRNLAVYRKNAETALKLLKVGESSYNEKLDVAELAAWTTVANTIFSLDEIITRE